MNIKLLSDFRDDESGGILAFTLIMFMTMVIGGGMAIDFINHETRREAVQDALDRGVLAATANAKASGTSTPAQITAANAAAVAQVRSYVSISGFNPDALGVTVSPHFSATSQRVDASAHFNVDTYFLRMAGINTLSGQAVSAAAVRVTNIEMSLVFDVSGSMDFDVYDPVTGAYLGRRIDLLKQSAKAFDAIMLSGDKPTYTSISVVPFSGQVALKPSLANEYVNFGNSNPWHTYSSCMQFNKSDFSTTAFGPLQARNQYEHFKIWGGRGGNRPAELVTWCPNSSAEIMPLANNKASIDAMIDGLTPQGSTNTWTGIKWGAALLDPSTRPIISHLSQNCLGGVCEIDPHFQNRPGAFNTPDTLKFMVVMTDGANQSELVIPKETYNAYRSVRAYTQQNADYWDQYNAGGVMYNSSGYLPGVVRTSKSEGDRRMQSMCTAAKDKGIVIFTIGVEATYGSNAYNQLQNCATTPGYFYSVKAANLSDAFNGIANTIQKLRLVN